MRSSFLIRPTGAIIPFNYQPLLTGAIHKWLGRNDVHDRISLYSFSWLIGAEARPNGLAFPRGARWSFSAFDNSILKKVVEGIQQDPEIGRGLRISDVALEEPPQFKNGEHTFLCSSPILVKRLVENRSIHYTFDQPETTGLLTQTLKHKLRDADLPTEGVSVSFVQHYPGARTKVIYYNAVGNKVNICPVKIKGTPEQLAFAWDVGIGNSTGIGFGSLR